MLGDATTHQVTLLGWELLKGQSPQPTDTVVVRLYWQPHGPINEELHSFLHLYTPSLQRSWAVAHNRRPSCQPATDWHPGNYYVDDLRLSIPVDTPPVTYSLVVGLVSSDGARLAVSGSTDDVLHLRTLDVTPTNRTGFFERKRFLREDQPTIIAPGRNRRRPAPARLRPTASARRADSAPLLEDRRGGCQRLDHLHPSAQPPRRTHRPIRWPCPGRAATDQSMADGLSVH